MTVAGIFVGPIFGWLEPDWILGELYSLLISIAVFVSFILTWILFIMIGDFHWLQAFTLGAIFDWPLILSILGILFLVSPISVQSSPSVPRYRCKSGR